MTFLHRSLPWSALLVAVGCGSPAATATPGHDVEFTGQDAQFGLDAAADAKGDSSAQDAADAADSPDAVDVQDSAKVPDAQDVEDSLDAIDSTDAIDPPDTIDAPDAEDAQSDVPSEVDSGSFGDLPAVPGSTLASFAADWIDAWCAAQLSCVTPTGSFSSVAACKAWYASGAADMPTSPWVVAASAQAGLATYDPKAGMECIAQLASSACATPAVLDSAACKGMFHGQASLGATCSSSADCQSGFCKLDPTQPACPGTCAEPGKAGAACVDDFGCDGGLACILGQCAPASGGQAGDTCGDFSCGKGLYCEQTGEASSACTPQLGQGQPCLLPTSCLAGLHCAMDPATFDATCQPAAALGKPCLPDSGYESFQPGQGTACVKGAVCAFGSETQASCLAVAQAGQPCEHPAQCAGVDLTCIGWKPGVKGVCGPLPKAGEACVPPTVTSGKDQACAGGIPCDPTTLTCKPWPGNGQACTVQCAEGLTCHQKLCQAPGKLSAACTVGQANACIPGLVCAGGVCASPVCP